MTLQLDRIPDIDYETHPVFAGLSAADNAVNAQADILISEIDAAYDAAQNSDNPQAVFERSVPPRLAALSQLAGNQAISPVFKSFLARALELAQDTLRQNLSARAVAPSNSAAQDLPKAFDDSLDSFRRDGFFQTASPDLARKVWRDTWIERAILRARATRNPRRHATAALHIGSPAMRAIARTARDSGLEKLMSAYLGKPVTLLYAALNYAHSAQEWFRGCYASNGMADSKTVYMHLDADADIIKAMFYLRDVTEKDGPFCFVRGSHRWQRSPCQSAIRKGFDAASHSQFRMTDDQLDYEQGYYRPRFQDADYRAGMLALPRALRGSTHFGDDVLDGSPLSGALLSQEHTFTDPAGTMVIFDGSRGIHRGSLTSDGGERWAIQLAFKAQKKPMSSGIAALRPRLSYFKYAACQLVNLATGKA